MSSARAILPLAFALSLLGVGCAPHIGDSCKSSTDCSINGDRICDFASPGGYCTVQGCDPDTCPGGSVCVEWRYDPPRTSQTYCMDACGTSHTCRQGDGYACLHAGDAALQGPDGRDLGRIIDLSDSSRANGFCASVVSE